MTQIDFKIKAIQFAQVMKSIASRIEYDAKDYDTRWPLEYVREINQYADDLISSSKTRKRTKK